MLIWGRERLIWTKTSLVISGCLPGLGPFLLDSWYVLLISKSSEDLLNRFYHKEMNRELGIFCLSSDLFMCYCLEFLTSCVNERAAFSFIPSLFGFVSVIFIKCRVLSWKLTSGRWDHYSNILSLSFISIIVHFFAVWPVLR